MIVRVMGEGQWRVDDALSEELNRLDDEALCPGAAALAAVNAGLR